MLPVIVIRGQGPRTTTFLIFLIFLFFRWYLMPNHAFGVGPSTISEKSPPCYSEGIILTHVVPDLAKLQIRVRGGMVFGASERLLNHPGVDVADPRCPEPKRGAHWDGQILTFYVEWWNLTVPMCTTLRFWAPRIVHIAPRVVQEPFKCSKNHHTS